MNKLLLILFLILGSAAMLVSCHHGEYLPNPLFAYADSVMEDQPDSALHYLQRLDVSDFSDADKAYYGLLITQATDKNYLPLLPCDSLIDAALDYYNEGDGLLRAKALLYKGRIQQAMNMPEEAMKNGFAGLKELGDSPKELRLKRMLYEDLGGIYQEQDLGKKALEMYHQSYYYDSLLNDDRLLKYSLANIGWAHVVLEHETIAKQYLDSALQIAIKQNDSAFISGIYSHLSLNCANTDSAFIYIRLAQVYSTDKVDSVNLFLSLGELFLDNGELDSADYYLKKVLFPNDLNKNMLAYYSLSELEKKRGNYQQAFEYRAFYGENIDSIFAMNRASDIERLAYKYEAEVEIVKEKAKHDKIVQAVVSSFFIFLFLFLLVIQSIYRRKKMAKLIYEQHIVQLEEKVVSQQLRIESSERDLIQLHQAQVQDKEEIARKEQEIVEMIDEKAKLRNWFFMQTPIYKRIEVLKQQDCKNVKAARVLIAPERQLLEETIYKIYDEHVQYLETTYPKFTKDDCIYCCLRLCELDDQAIAYCFGNTNKQIVAQRRLRLKDKMKVSCIK